MTHTVYLKPKLRAAEWNCLPSEFQMITDTTKFKKKLKKGKLNLDQKWQSDDLFYIIMNEIHHRFNQF